MNSSVTEVAIQRIKGKERIPANDILAIEEPLEIRISFVNEGKRIEKNISVTMRTPGNDEELAIGFLFTEGIISDADEIISVSSPKKNVITVFVSDKIDFNAGRLERHFYTTSSCGVCGKSSIDAIRTVRKASAEIYDVILSPSEIFKLPALLRIQQDVFEKTGGLHASALFETGGNMIGIREDVGRHNALDKLIGHCLQKRKNLSSCLLLLSGRASFELLQKAYMTGINIVAAVGAPSSLAVEFATEKNMTLIGFLRDERFNVYCGGERVTWNGAEIY